MEFNKPPEWGARFQFPENFPIGIEQSNIVDRITLVMAEQYDNFVVEQIAREARASGVSDLTVLNKMAILGAIKKQIAEKVVVIDHGTASWGFTYHCPNCNKRLIRKTACFCDECGQALDWEE